MNVFYASTLNKAMGWIVAVWLLLALFSEGGKAPVICLAGAVVTVCLWAYIAMRFDRADRNNL